MSTSVIGILLGLGAATFQSLSYIFSRLFVIRRHEAPMRLLVGAHVCMALFALAILPMAWSDQMPPFQVYAWHVVRTNIPYLCAQLSLFIMMRHTEASRVAPLLALKIVVLALLTSVFMDRVLSGRQWIAALLCLAGAFSLGISGKRLPLRILPWLACSLLGYSLADINIEQLVLALAPVSKLRASVIATCLSYVFCGVIVLPLVPWAGGRRLARDWRYVLPFAVAWFGAMICLFACFGYVGPVFGNILQSLRGILCILIGAVLAKHGFSELEERLPPRVLLFRIGAAGMMVAAIYVFATGR